jgi:transketolase
VRNTFAETLYEAAQADPRIYVVAADISPAGPMAKFAADQPERFINVGVAEQVMIGMCGGLALKGMRPFAYTIATFSLYRPFEMVRVDLCYQNLPVTVVGMGAGVIYSQLGGTHNAQEDVAVAGAIPNMQILTPCDPLEVRDMTRFCAVENRGPLYLRLGKAGEPKLTERAPEPFVFGKLRLLRPGRDVCILSYGVIMKMVYEVADALEAGGASVAVANVHTLKPIDEEGIARVLRDFRKVVVVEEHAPQGGLAARTRQIAWETKAACTLKTFTLQDRFIHCYGTHEDLMAAHGLSVPQILAGLR